MQIDCSAVTINPPMATARATSAALAPAVTKASPQAAKPPLKWAGGKRWQVPYLEPLWSKHSDRRLVEPFCGGLAVTLSLQPEKALLNDVNPHLINFYIQLQRGLIIMIAMENNEQLFYDHRARFNELLASGHGATPEAAAFFYYLNRTGYNGLCRFNSRGEFNVPFGKYKNITYTRDFSAYVEVLQRWTFTHCHFKQIDLRPDDFVYADPPYDVEFTHYSQGGFHWDEQVRTAEWLSTHRGPVILVNQATRRIMQLYKQLGFKTRTLDAPRRINCTGDRTPAREVIATRNI